MWRRMSSLVLCPAVYKLFTIDVPRRVFQGAALSPQGKKRIAVQINEYLFHVPFPISSGIRTPASMSGRYQLS